VDTFNVNLAFSSHDCIKLEVKRPIILVLVLSLTGFMTLGGYLLSVSLSLLICQMMELQKMICKVPSALIFCISLESVLPWVWQWFPIIKKKKNLCFWNFTVLTYILLYIELAQKLFCTVCHSNLYVAIWDF